MNQNEYNEVSARISRLESVLNGGKGSGNFGHYGRPGLVGGSAGDSSGGSVADIKKEIRKAQEDIAGITSLRALVKESEKATESTRKAIKTFEGLLGQGYGDDIIRKRIEEHKSLLKSLEASVEGNKKKLEEALEEFEKRRENSSPVQINGGPGSGNFGHYGRPGEVGGSADTPMHLFDLQTDEERIGDRDKRYEVIYQGIKDNKGIMLDNNDNPIEWGKDDGFLVRGYGKRTSISVKDFEDANERFAFIQDFESSNLGHLLDEKSVTSGWVKDGQVVLDASKRFKTAKEATKEAALRGQKAIVDIKKVKTLDTKEQMKKHKISEESIEQEKQKAKDEDEKRRKKGEVEVKVRYTQGLKMKRKTYNELMGKIQRLEKLLNQERPDPQTIIETDQDKKYGIDKLTERIVSDKAKIKVLKARIDKMVSLMAEGQNPDLEKMEAKLKALEDDLTEAEAELRIADSKKKEEQALVENGGKGSGNFGHRGRPGMVGGSGDGYGMTILEKAERRGFGPAPDLYELAGEQMAGLTSKASRGEGKPFHSRYEDKDSFEYKGQTFYVDEDKRGGTTKDGKISTMFPDEILFEREKMIRGWEGKSAKKMKYTDYYHMTQLYSRLAEDDVKKWSPYSDKKDKAKNHELRERLAKVVKEWEKDHPGVEFGNSLVEKRLNEMTIAINGGKGSGNFGHYGRPGMVGGSASADGAVRAIGKGIADRMRETGGFTVSTQGEFKELGSAKGFGVGGFGTERSISVDEWKNSTKRRAFIKKYLEENRQTFYDDPERNHFGGWEDDGRVYLDVTRIFKSEKEAAREAAKTHQDAITDFSKTYESGKAFPRTKDLVKKYGLQDEWKKSAGVRKAERKADQESQKKTDKKKKDPLENIPF